MKYYLIAGEASGDLHGANLMKQIAKKDSDANFRFWGGDKMASVGGTQVEHYKNTAFMGFLEVIKNLRTILGFIKICKKDIVQYAPDVLILIDYPGFNLRIAEFAKKQGFKIVYYISPQVWAWKASRVHKIKKCVDKMLVILPFEQEFYQKYDYKVDFVGHPLLDVVDNDIVYEKWQKEKPIIALLPGSRQQEIQKILPEFLSVVKTYPQYDFVLGGLTHIGADFYQKMIGDLPVKIKFNDTYTLLKNSGAALVASGTATLETALFGIPMVVGYKGSWLSYTIGKILVDIKYISLANLIMNKKIVDELIQNDLTKDKIIASLNKVLDQTKQENIQAEYNILRQKLGESGASERAATIVQSIL